MAAEKKTIYLHNGFGQSSFAAMHVSSNVTELEAQKLSTRRSSLPDNNDLHYFTLDCEFGLGTSFVCLDNTLYAIGGTIPFSRIIKPVYMNVGPITDVYGFDTTQQEDISLQSFNLNIPSLKEGRCFAEVAAVNGKIYAFGGISKENTGDGVWAEYFEPGSLSHEWKPLSEPPLRILAKDRPFSMMLGDEKIYIGGMDISKEGVIYDFNRDCWERQKLYSKYLVVTKPMYVEKYKSMYWLSGDLLLAVDLETGILYCGDIRSSVLLGMLYILQCTYWGPILMHLKDDIFCIFTVYSEEPAHRSAGVVECIKFRVSKGAVKNGEGDLNIHMLGYQSYKCDPMWKLYCLVPMVNSKYDSQEKKRKREVQSCEFSSSSQENQIML